MKTELWAGTRFESFVAEILAEVSPLQLAFHIGQTGSMIADLFGVMPAGEPVPDEAQQAALILLDGFIFARDHDDTVAKVQALRDQWRARRN